MTAHPLTLDLAAIGGAFDLPGTFIAAERYGSGHINDTYAARFRHADVERRYILQRINPQVFHDAGAVMENVDRVLAHLRSKLANHPDAARRALTLVPTRNGERAFRDSDGATWRCYHFIGGASSHDILTRPDQARQAAAAFGAFQRQLLDLPGPRLRETLPDFHNTPRRLDALARAVADDRVGRARACGREIDFALARSTLAGELVKRHAAGLLPERITHNDTKLNNVLLDDVTGEGLCVIDLDTVMPGLALYDFGDMVRTAVSAAPEDADDLDAITVRMPFYAALVEGYLSSAGSFLTRDERACLALSGRLITYEIGLRFLTDHLQGDVYFQIHRPAHNLIRARAQFRLVEAIEARLDEMNALAKA